MTTSMMNKLEEISKNSNESIDDGVYDITGIEVCELEDANENEQEVDAFVEKYPNFYIAAAYETDSIILLASEPKEFKGSHLGNWFNYGSNNILRDCPKDILILAEND